VLIDILSFVRLLLSQQPDNTHGIYQPHARPRRYAVTPKEMLAELCADNRHLTRSLRSTHEVCDRHNDVATASLIENWIDETERRTWFLSEIERDV
jgi:DNA-binding ferritin-like protein